MVKVLQHKGNFITYCGQVWFSHTRGLYFTTAKNYMVYSKYQSYPFTFTGQTPFKAKVLGKKTWCCTLLVKHGFTVLAKNIVVAP